MPMATAGLNGRTYVNINMSRSVSLSFIDETGSVIPVNNLASPIELIIPRDSSLTLPSMTFENVTGQIQSSTTPNNNRQFLLYYINVTAPTTSLTLSATFEYKSDDPTLGFMIIYRFDAIPILNSTMNLTDGYDISCPKGK